MQARIVDEFWKRVYKVELTGCWLWTGYINKETFYGTWSFWEDGKTTTVYAHRFSYELLIGPIPEKMVLDHKCYVRFCVNPAHLEPVTQSENLRRRRTNGGAEFQRSKTHCVNGHPYSGENLTIFSSGKRGCKACARERMRAKRAELSQEPRVYEKATHCKNGHEFTEENTYVVPSTGQRNCRECKREDVRRYRERNRETYRERDRGYHKEAYAARKAAAPPKPAKTHCSNGHELTPDNIYVAPGTGHKRCKACQRNAENKRKRGSVDGHDVGS